MKTGKRDAKDAIEKQVLDNKKQKVVNGDMEQGTDENKFEMEVSGDLEQGSEENKFEMETENNIKEDQTNNLDENSFSRSEEEKNKVEVSLAINSVTTLDAKRSSSSNDSVKEDGDDNCKETDRHSETPNKSPQTPITYPATGSKLVLMDNLSFSIKEADVRTFFKSVGEIAEVHFEMKEDYFTGRGYIEFTTAEAAQEAIKLDNELLLDQQLRLHLATERVGALTTTHATGSKTLYLGNLSFSVEEDDVRDFFKDVGEIAELRFAIRDDRFLGYGHIEFTTAEAAQEALKLNNEVILDRPVKLDLARPRERGAYTPNSSTEKFKQKGGQTHGKTIFIRGFDSSDGFENIRSALERHFGKCGEISRMSIPRDYESGGPRGVAFIEFTERSGLGEAITLDGSEFGGKRITVEEAKNPKGDSREGSAHSGSRGFGGGWNGSGSGSSWHTENSYGGGWRSRGRGSSHRESGSSRYVGRESGFGRGAGWGRGSGSSGGGRFGSGGGSVSGWNRGTGSGGSGFRPFSSGRVGRFSDRRS